MIWMKKYSCLILYLICEQTILTIKRKTLYNSSSQILQSFCSESGMKCFIISVKPRKVLKLFYKYKLLAFMWIETSGLVNIYLTWRMLFQVTLPKIPMDLWNANKQVGPYELEVDHQSRLPPSRQSAKTETCFQCKRFWYTLSYEKF